MLIGDGTRNTKSDDDLLGGAITLKQIREQLQPQLEKLQEALANGDDND